MNQDARIYRRSADIVARRIVDELILVPVRRTLGDVECIYTLNEVGASVWDLIDGERPLREIRDLIVAQFEVNQEEAGNDLLTLLEQLRDIGALTEVSPDGA